MELTDAEKEKFELWVIENVDANIVPNDEGNDGALIFNLVHLIRGDGQKFDYSPEQVAEVERYG